MINQVIKYCLLITVLGALLGWIFTSQINAFAPLIGVAWASANFYLLCKLTENILLNKSFGISLWLIVFKFPLLYWVGYQTLKLNIWNPWFILAGFTLFLIVMIINGCFQLLRGYP